jgi:acetyl esterase/lipase
LELSVFAPGKRADLYEVLIFIHGGSWNSGKKSLYNFFGSRMARKNVVVVTIDYPLSPKANYHQMAVAVAKAVEWVKKNIETFGGNPKKIFISGHSAGGHLAALVTLRNQYFDSLGMSSPIKGIILIDAAGLDMFGYLQEEKFPEDHSYFKTFTKNPTSWKDASPLYHLHHHMPPMLIYRGEKTYPSILRSHQKFIIALKEYAPDTEYHVLKGKKHVPMITQFFKPWNPRYKEIIMFMKRSD